MEMETVRLSLNLEEDYILNAIAHQFYESDLFANNVVLGTSVRIGSLTVSPNTCHGFQASVKRPATVKSATKAVAAKQPKTVANFAKVSTSPISKSSTYQLTATPNAFQTFTSESGGKMFFCDLCLYKSNQRGNIMRHYKVTHSQNCPKFKCSMCDVTLKEKNKLKPHYMKSHNLPESLAISAMRESVQV